MESTDSNVERHSEALDKSFTLYTDLQKSLSDITLQLGLSIANLLNCFLFGLREDIRRELFLLKSPTLHEAIGMAKLVEDKLTASRFSNPRSPTVRPVTNPSTQQPLVNRNNPLPIKRLSPTEMAARREKGLCFNCDEAFLPGHRFVISPETTSSLLVHKAPTPILDEALQQLLVKYNTIFSVPKGLPPTWPFDHGILLLPNTSPVNVKPYRYPHFQKTEMEKLISEILLDGIIRPSNILFSSLVLLVKKKDRIWHFCVDYRAINAVTVKDRFPIPIVDELLDELHGATIFSKLDLRAGYHQLRIHEDNIVKMAF
ncbi:hypothetical protein Tco_0401945 [Tanacetum coccineum]